MLRVRPVAPRGRRQRVRPRGLGGMGRARAPVGAPGPAPRNGIGDGGELGMEGSLHGHRNVGLPGPSLCGTDKYGGCEQVGRRAVVTPAGRLATPCGASVQTGDRRRPISVDRLVGRPQLCGLLNRAIHGTRFHKYKTGVTCSAVF